MVKLLSNQKNDSLYKRALSLNKFIVWEKIS